MKVCDRHKKERAVLTLPLAEAEGYDLCEECAKDLRSWLQCDITTLVTPAKTSAKKPKKPLPHQKAPRGGGKK